MEFNVVSVILGAVLLMNLMGFVKNAPIFTRMRPHKFQTVQVERIKTNTSCPFVIESDINENRIPVKIDRIKCAPTKSECQNCKEDAGYECVQAVMGVSVTFFNRMNDDPARSVSDEASKQLMIKDVKDGSMYTTYEERIQVQVGCFCANINADEAEPAEILEHKRIDSK